MRAGGSVSHRWILAFLASAIALAGCQTTEPSRRAGNAGRGGETDLKAQYAAAGIFETGLAAEMPSDAVCPPIQLGFGGRYSRTGRLRGRRDGSYHAGVDWGPPVGTPIVAIADGRVAVIQNDMSKAPGNHVIIRHRDADDGRDEYSSSYTHLLRVNVARHQSVRKGEVIGFLGQTGSTASWPHLHLNIYGRDRVTVEGRTWRYRYDYLQFLSGDMSPVDPNEKRHRKVPVAYVDQVGKVHPPDAKVVWPFVCRTKK